MQKILLLMLVIQFLHANAIAKNDDILEELEFYLKNENKNTIREQNKSAIRQDLKISQQNLMEILDNKPRLTSDNNNLHALNNVIKINDSTVSSDLASSDLNFPQDNGVIANENNRKDVYNIAKNIQISSNSSPILRFITRTVRPFIEERVDAALVQMGVMSELRKNIDMSSRLKINTIRSGAADGQQVTCGRSVEITMGVEDEYGDKVKTDYDDQRFWLTVGGNEFTRSLELGLIGAKIGEEREITAPSTLNIGASAFAQNLMQKMKKTTFKVKIHDIREDEELDNIKNIRYYDTVASLNRKLSCGDLIKTDLKLLNAKGDILYEKPQEQLLILNLGSGASKYLEHVLIGAHSLGQRIVFADTDKLDSLKNLPALQGIDKIINEYKGLIIELTPRFVFQ